MKDDCFVASCWGLGDWLIINPIIRILSKKYKKIYIVYNDYCKKFIKYMFSDLNNIVYEYHCGNKIPDINQIQLYCDERGFDLVNLIVSGRFNKDDFIVDCDKLKQPFNINIYKNSGFDWESDNKHFFIPYNDDESDVFLKSLNLSDNFIFLHEGPYPKINRCHLINKSSCVFIPFEIENVFLYKSVIEKAEEIHVVDSGFYNFVDKLNLKTDKIFLHHTKKLQSPLLTPKLTKKWNHIKYEYI